MSLSTFKCVTAALLTSALLAASCAPEFTKNIPCTNDNECPTGYFCSTLKCVKGSNPGTIDFTVVPEQELVFGQIQNGTSKTLEMVVNNVAQSDAPLKVKAAVDSGGGIFSVSPGGFVTIEPKSKSGSQRFTVNFAPGAGDLGDFRGTLSVTADQPWKASPQKNTIRLAGSSMDPSFVFSPTEIDFNREGDKDVEIKVNADEVRSRSITVQNQGSPDSTLTVTEINLNDDYNKKLELANLPALPYPLAAGKEFKFDVLLKPKEAFTANTKVVIKTDDKDRLTGNITVKASVSNCEPGWYSTSDKANCTCQALPRGGDTCAKAEELKFSETDPELPDNPPNRFIIVENVNLVPNQEKWFTFVARDDMIFEKTFGRDPFHVRVQLEQGLDYDDQIVMEVFSVKNKLAWINMEYLCGGPTAKCEESQCGNMILNLDKYNIGGLEKYRMDFYTDLSVMGADQKPIGECGCDPAADPNKGYKDKNFCRDDTQRFYIKLHRKQGALTTCKKYKITISNGYYADDKCK
jgi:hypothetical protein